MKNILNLIKKYNLIKKLLEILVAILVLSLPIFVKQISFSEIIDIPLIENEKVYILPEENNIVYDFINKAKASVNITIYMLSDNKLKNKLIEKYKNGVKINIILEKTPYGGGSINYKTYNEFLELGINIKYSNPEFSLTHAKYIIIDRAEALIMTCNLTHAGLYNDRDFVIYENNKNIVDELNVLFKKDFEYKKYSVKNNNLIISPVNSRQKLESLIENSKSNIKMYAENIIDENIKNLLLQKLKNNISIEIIVPESKKLEANQEVLKTLESGGAKIKYLKKPYQHAKILIIDGEIMYLGSINFSRQSMEENREVGIISINKNSINKVLDTFNKDLVKY